jgi:hypothetical protein
MARAAAQLEVSHSGPLKDSWTLERATVRPVRQDVSDEQWNAVEEGELAAPSGTFYSRRTTRMKRKDADSLVASGCPVVTYWPGGLPEMTRVVWHDGEDAREVWAGARAEVTSDAPHPPRRGAVATAGRWESVDGQALLVLTWHH